MTGRSFGISMDLIMHVYQNSNLIVGEKQTKNTDYKHFRNTFHSEQLTEHFKIWETASFTRLCQGRLLIQPQKCVKY